MNIVRMIAFVVVFLSVTQAWAAEFVVIKESTKFYTTASNKTVFFEGKNDRLITLRYVKEKEDRVLVELKRVTNDCQNIVRTVRANIYLWVPQSALETVITKPQHFKFKDGSEVDLATGLVVRSGKVLSRGEEMTLRIPKDATGKRFRKIFLSENAVDGGYSTASAKRKKAKGFHSTKKTKKERAFDDKLKNAVENMGPRPKGAQVEVGLGMASRFFSSAKGLRYNGKYFLKKDFFQTKKVGEFDVVADRCRRIKGRLSRPQRHVFGAKGSGSGFVRHTKISRNASIYDLEGKKIGVTTNEVAVVEGYFTQNHYCAHLDYFFETKKTFVLCFAKEEGPTQ